MLFDAARPLSLRFFDRLDVAALKDEGRMALKNYNRDEQMIYCLMHKSIITYGTGINGMQQQQQQRQEAGGRGGRRVWSAGEKLS
jgi:hypothetical protein